MSQIIASNLIGGGITLAVSVVFYVLAGKQLRKEAAELRRLSEMVLHSLEQAGLVQFVRDANGKITGLNIVVKLAGSEMKAHGGVVGVRNAGTGRNGE